MDKSFDVEIENITKKVISYINRQSISSFEENKWAFQIKKYILRDSDNSNELIKAGLKKLNYLYNF